MNWIRNNKLIIIFIITIFIVLGYPLFILGIYESFFIGLDPEVVYVTNALLYTKYAIISYMDHPGTPTIMLLYYLFFPLRLMAKYILHQGFIQWSFDNYAFLTYYIRVFELILTTVALFIYLKVVKQISKSSWIVLFAGLSAYLFAGITMATRIVPENLSFLLTAIWLVAFIKFAKTRKYSWNVLLLCVSGFAFANKFTTVFLLITSILLPFFIRGANLGRKITMLEANITISFQAFLFGVWPIRDKLAGIIDWGMNLFNHTNIHGTGVASTFDWDSYSSSFLLLIKDQPSTFTFIGLTFLLGIYLLITNRLKINDPFIFLESSAFIGIFVFAKYPLIYYNYVNVLLMIFCATYFLSKVKIRLAKILLFVVVVMFLISLRSVINYTIQLKNVPSETVNSILTRWSSWSDNVFSEQLKTVEFTKP